jgi:CBS-domain-containing membrane protein
MPQQAWKGRAGVWLRGFLPASLGVSGSERLRGCCGALTGLLLTGLLCGEILGAEAASPMLIAPMGASAVLLFAVPASPLAQPWSIMGGNVVSALVGVTCARWIGDPLLAAPLAVAEMHAYRRRFGEITCADIMSRDVVAVQFGTPLRDAWSLLRRHDIRALPVLDPARRLIGMVSDVDFMASPELDVYDGLWERFHRLIRRPDTLHTDRAEVVGQIMSRDVQTVSEDVHIVELVPLMADAGLRHVAVVDAEQRLSGIISQADLVAALYRGSLAIGGEEMHTRAA